MQEAMGGMTFAEFSEENGIVSSYGPIEVKRSKDILLSE